MMTKASERWRVCYRYRMAGRLHGTARLRDFPSCEAALRWLRNRRDVEAVYVADRWRLN